MRSISARAAWLKNAKPLVVLGVAIYRIAVKQRRCINEECRRSVCLAVKRPGRNGCRATSPRGRRSPAPRDIHPWSADNMA